MNKEQLSLAYEAYQTGDYSSSFTKFETLAKQGVRVAQFYLGQSYEYGYGTPKDDALALKWYLAAAEQGNVSAQFCAGQIYEFGANVPRNYAAAAHWYKKAADRGNAYAQHHLGTMYARGLGVTQDDSEALKWYRRSSDGGCADALNNIGFMYEHGRGVPLNAAIAAEHYEKAAIGGSAVGQFNLSGFFLDGKGGLNKDIDKALYWSSKAAEQKFAAAINRSEAILKKKNTLDDPSQDAGRINSEESFIVPSHILKSSPPLQEESPLKFLRGFLKDALTALPLFVGGALLIWLIRYPFYQESPWPFLHSGLVFAWALLTLVLLVVGLGSLFSMWHEKSYWKTPVFIGLAIFSYSIFGTLLLGSREYRLDENCKVTELPGQFEEKLLGQRFWQDQIGLIDKEIESLEKIPAILAEVKANKEWARQEAAEMVRDSNLPDLQSLASKEAEDLRRRANEIEESAMNARREREQLDTLDGLFSCRKLASTKYK